jgi:hypothetical protein
MSRTKSLIKPPPPRTSWELLLDDYLQDPNFQSFSTLKPSPDASPTYQQSTTPVSSGPTPQAFIPLFYPQYVPYVPYPTRPRLPPRRYQMTLDELVYLVSQVGRCDLYREMVQQIKSQPLPTPSSPLLKPTNLNAYPGRRFRQTISLNDGKKERKSHRSRRTADELIKELNRLKLHRRIA